MENYMLSSRSKPTAERAPRLIFHDEHGSICIDACRNHLFLTTVSGDDEAQIAIDAESEVRLRQLLNERANQAGER
jgi:hypothetical protein